MMKTDTFYHASPAKLKPGDVLVTPTGASGWNVTSGEVTYLTDSPEACKRYGTVYKVSVPHAKPYALLRQEQGLRKKKGRYTRGVWCAPGGTATITGRAK